MQIRTQYFMFLILAAHLVGCGRSPSAITTGPVVATVNGSTITEGELAFLAKVGPPRIKARLQSAAGKQQVIEDLVDRELLYQDSVARGLDRDPEVKAQLQLNQRILVATAVLQKEIETAARAYYDAHLSEFRVVPLRHIAIHFGGPSNTPAARSEPEAVKRITALKTRIEQGAAFADVAQEASEDPITKSQGGLLGKVSQKEARLLRRGYETLLEKAFALTPNTVAGPFKTTEGYHLIIIDAAPAQQPFEEVAQEIEFRVRDDARQRVLQALREKAKITYPEKPQP